MNLADLSVFSSNFSVIQYFTDNPLEGLAGTEVSIEA